MSDTITIKQPCGCTVTVEASKFKTPQEATIFVRAYLWRCEHAKGKR